VAEVEDNNDKVKKEGGGAANERTIIHIFSTLVIFPPS
jgi:hypothetical protein